MIPEKALKEYRPDVFLNILNRHLSSNSQLEMMLNDSTDEPAKPTPRKWFSGHDKTNQVSSESSSNLVEFFYFPHANSGRPIFGANFAHPLVLNNDQKRQGFLFRVKLIDGVYIASLSYKGPNGFENNSSGNRNLEKYAPEVYSKLVDLFVSEE